MEESDTKKKGVQKIYIVRHGQTDYNLKGIIQGSGVDSSLNATGRRQAQAFYEAYKNVPFDHFFTSALKRTKESISAFINESTPLTSLSELNEISWGPYDGVMDTSEKDSYYWNTLSAWNEGKTDFCIEGGESPMMVKERVARGWERIIANSQASNILVCMHGRAIRILLCHITNTDLQFMDKFKHTNLGLYVIELQDGKAKVVIENEKSHLH